ncbi:MAG: NAD(P)/FAD-dependent oxidoreductase [Candidatus Methanospirareceae archaeon]
MSRKVVIIGCSGVGGPAAMMMKKLDPSSDVTLIREEEKLFVRCTSPYISVGIVNVDACFKDDGMFRDAGVKLVNARATRINREEKTVTTEDGNIFHYDKLVLATGGKPIIPPIPGVDLKGVFPVRTSQDAVNISSWIKERGVAHVVVIGAGGVGLEMASLIAKRGIGVTVVEMLEHVIQTSFDPDMSEEIEGYLRRKGVNLRLKEKVERIIGDKEVEEVELSSGERIKADMVILAAGVRPNIELAEAAGLEVGKYGVRVNKYLQTSDPDIYAAGDLIEYESAVTGKPIPGYIRANAVIGGRVIAKNIQGYKIEFPRLLNSFSTKLFDMVVASTGITERIAKEEGIEVIAVKKGARSKYAMIEGGRPYTMKLIFERETGKVIGGQIIGYSESSIRYIDVIALAIRCGLTALDLTTLRCASQPELSTEASAEPIALAAEDAFQLLYPLKG